MQSLYALMLCGFKNSSFKTSPGWRKRTYYAPSIGWSKNQATNMDIWQLGLNNVWEKFPANLISNNLAIAVSLKY